MMGPTYWHKQTSDKPLFPNLLWSRPENRRQAGKLLIIGGNGYEFKAPANAYGDALDAGIGAAKVLLPDSMRKTVADIFPEAEFAPVTPSGSFARNALGPILDLAAWADSVLIAGDIGRNSETAVLIETVWQKYTGRLAMTKDSVDYLLNAPTACLSRLDTLLVLTTAQLQRLASAAGFIPAFTSDMGLVRFAESLHTFSETYAAYVVVKHQDTIFVAVNGQISTTPNGSSSPWRVRTAAQASTWWQQNPTKPFEALTTAVHQL